jgi:hypothetical protein
MSIKFSGTTFYVNDDYQIIGPRPLFLDEINGITRGNTGLPVGIYIDQLFYWYTIEAIFIVRSPSMFV